jgi:hypothetical protein
MTLSGVPSRFHVEDFVRAAKCINGAYLRVSVVPFFFRVLSNTGRRPAGFRQEGSPDRVTRPLIVVA